MTILTPDNLIKELSVLGKDATLSLTQRQKIRDQLFKKMGQVDLIDAVQTHTEVNGLVMSLRQLQSLFQPRRVSFSAPATAGMVLAVFVVTFATGAFAMDDRPGDPLFGVRKALEAVQIALVSDPAQKAEMQLAIADNRLQGLETVDSAKLGVVLQESKKALTNAQTAISGLKTTDGKSNTDLINKLKTLIDNQKATLTTITKSGGATEDIQKTILAMRGELDALITKDTKSAIDNSAVTKPVVDDTNRTVFYGSLVTNYGVPSLLENGKIYTLAGIGTDITGYLGVSNVVINGKLSGKILTVSKITINNKLIWENTPDKDINTLSWVEGDKNTSLR